MHAADPRRLAHEVLVRVEGGAFCDLLIGETLGRGRIEPRDAALFTRLVYGTVAWQGRLDWTLALLSRRPLERLDPAVRVALRLGLLQLTQLDRIPDHAAVDTSVELAKRAAGPAAGRFVNAVLRTALRQGGERPLPREEDGLARALAVRWSHPEWLVQRWLVELGRERTVALLEADGQPAPTVLRVDLRARSRDAALAELATRGIAARACAHAPAAIELEAPLATIAEIPWLAPQGEASQLVAELVDARPGERILDLCAAPGGKSAALAERWGSGIAGLLIAADRSRPGIRRVRERARGEPPLRIATLLADAQRPPFAAATFDAVLLDAPCSGLGTLRSHPEIRWRRSEEEIAPLGDRQRRMLHAAARLVRPGGRLIYATCTLLAAENEEVVAELLRGTARWRLRDARAVLGEGAATLVGPDGALRTSPERGGLDGFFAVRLERAVY